MNLIKASCFLCPSIYVVPLNNYENLSVLSTENVELARLNYKKNHLIYLCPVCLYDIEAIKSFKERIMDISSAIETQCCLCKGMNHLITFGNWYYFDKVLKNVTTDIREKNKTYSACLNCIKHLEILENAKIKFRKKYHKGRTSKSLKEQKAINEIPPTNKPGLKKSLQNTKKKGKKSPIVKAKYATNKLKNDPKLYKKLTINLDRSKLIDKFIQKNEDETTTKPGLFANDKIVSKIAKRLEKPKCSFFKIKLKKSKKKRGLGSRKDKMSEKKKELVIRMVKMELNRRKYNGLIVNNMEMLYPNSHSEIIKDNDSMDIDGNKKVLKSEVRITRSNDLSIEDDGELTSDEIDETIENYEVPDADISVTADNNVSDSKISIENNEISDVKINVKADDEISSTGTSSEDNEVSSAENIKIISEKATVPFDKNEENVEATSAENIVENEKASCTETNREDNQVTSTEDKEVINIEDNDEVTSTEDTTITVEDEHTNSDKSLERSETVIKGSEKVLNMNNNLNKDDLVEELNSRNTHEPIQSNLCDEKNVQNEQIKSLNNSNELPIENQLTCVDIDDDDDDDVIVMM